MSDDLEQPEEAAREPLPLTDREREILVAIDAHEKQYGVTPSLKEIAEAIGLPGSSKSWVKTKLDALELKGWIARTYLPSGIRPARSIRILHRPPAAFVRVDALLVLLVLVAIVLVTKLGVQKIDGFAADVRDARDNARTCTATLERAVDRIETEQCEEPAADVALVAGDEMPIAELASFLGKPELYVHKRMRLTKLCAEAVEAFNAESLTLAGAEHMTILDDDGQRAVLTEAKGWAAPWAANMIRGAVLRQTRDLKSAPWRLDDAELVAAAGSCLDCGKRTGAQRTFIIEDTGDDKCTDSKCWTGKTKAESARRVDDAKTRGLKILQGKEAEKVVTSYGSMAGGYVNLDETCAEDPKHRTWRQVVKKAEIAGTVIVPRKDGMPIEAVTRAAAKKAAADAGAAWAKPDPKPATAKHSASTSKPAKGGLVDERDIGDAIQEALVERLAKSPPKGLLRALAIFVIEHMYMMRDIEQARGVKKGGLAGWARKATDDQLLGLLGHYVVFDCVTPDDKDLRDLAVEVGVDVKGIEKDLRAKAAAELADKKDAKKPAKKGRAA